jgi:hypothetical protein
MRAARKRKTPAYANLATVINRASEHQLQVSVLQHLALTARRNVRWHATPNAARRSLRMGAYMKKEGLVAGVADICIRLPAGRVAWLEMKTHKGRQTLAQKVFQAECVALEHPYGLARSFDEAVKFLTSVGALR